MNNFDMTIAYQSHREIQIEDDTTYLVKVSVTGPVLLRASDNQYVEGITCEVFVQPSECRSDSQDDLLRCATKRLEQLSREAHEKAVREML